MNAIPTTKTPSRLHRLRTWALWFVLGTEIVLLLTPGGIGIVRNVFWRVVPTPNATFLTLSGSPAEMGATHGRERRFAIRLLCNLYIRRMLCNNDPDVLQRRCDQAKALFDRLDSRWQVELGAIGQAVGVAEGTLMLGNTFLDLGLNTAACRQVLLANDDTALHAHNMDWDNLGGVGNFLVTVFRTEPMPGRYLTLHVAFPGMVGALDVINEKGLSLSFNQVRNSAGKVDLPVFLMMREIAETCASMAEVETYLSKIPRTMPFCLGVMDAAAGTATVFERDVDQVIRRRPMTDGLLTADNSLYAGQSMAGNSVADVAAEIHPAGHAEVIQVLRHPRVLLECNIYSVIFDYRHNRFFLASGGIPAALGEYKEFVLFAEPGT